MVTFLIKHMYLQKRIKYIKNTCFETIKKAKWIYDTSVPKILFYVLSLNGSFKNPINTFSLMPL